MHRFNVDYFGALNTNAWKHLGGRGTLKNVRNRNHYYRTWIKMFKKMEKRKRLKDIDDLRNSNNEEYGRIIQQVANIRKNRYAKEVQQYVIKVSGRNREFNIALDHVSNFFYLISIEGSCCQLLVKKGINIEFIYCVRKLYENEYFHHNSNEIL